MYKKQIIMLLIALIILTACGKEDQNIDYGTAVLQTHYQALEEISYDSEIIVEVELTGKTETINYKDADFKVTEAEVKKVLKGEERLKSSMIRILEVAAFSMNDHKKNVLFLEEYVGPVTSNAYVVAGVYQGKFKLDKDNKLIYDADKNGGIKSFQSELDGLDIQIVEAKVKQAIKNERPVKSPQISETQRKKFEEESKELLKKDKTITEN
jgi:major membrane immunogen (membrane-anchored lipoprotein)